LVKRITVVNRFFAPDLSPTSELLTQLAARLAAEGWVVTAVASRSLYNAPGALPPTDTIDGVSVRRLWVTRLARHGLAGRVIDYLTFYIMVFLVLTAHLRRGDILVVNTDPPLIGLVCLLAARLRGARLVNWLHDLYPEVAAAHGLAIGRGPVGGVLERLRDASLRGAGLNIAICQEMAASVERRAPGVPVRVIHNWCDDQAIRPIPAQANPLRAAWELEGLFVVGYSGNLGRTHDWRTIALAAQRLGQRDDVLFLMIGGGAGMTALQAEVTRLGLERRFRFKPYQPREALALTLALADLHLVSLLPAFNGLLFPSKLYAAAAAGRGVIAIGDPAGELATLVRRHRCGEAAASGDDAGLAAIVESCVADPHLTAEWGARARAMIEEGFSRDHALACWTAAIAQLV
jgi:glycosyltransferase involved in cell wall biosynthesis